MTDVVDELDEGLRREVSAFLAGLPDEAGGCFEHDPRWLDVLDRGLGHQTMAVIARAGGATSTISGYLPLALVKSRLFGRFLVSLPYLNRAGVVAVDASARAELVDQAAALADRFDAQYLELRHGPATLDHPSLTQSRTDKVLMLLDLPADADTLWKGFDAKVRNQVRKGEKAGLSLRWGGAELLEDFYAVFSVNMRDLGTPVYARKLFRAILEHFPREAELAVVDHGGQPVAAALLVHDPLRRQTQAPSASSLRAMSHTNANMWMYAKLLERAIERGSRAFDFGRSSPDSGTYRFKKQWGARPLPTTWQYHIRHGEIGAMRPSDPKMQRRIAAWQKLPVWITRLVGPSIVRGIP